MKILLFQLFPNYLQLSPIETGCFVKDSDRSEDDEDMDESESLKISKDKKKSPKYLSDDNVENVEGKYHRRRSRAVLYQLSGTFNRQTSTKSKIQLSKVWNFQFRAHHVISAQTGLFCQSITGKFTNIDEKWRQFLSNYVKCSRLSEVLNRCKAILNDSLQWNVLISLHSEGRNRRT